MFKQPLLALEVVSSTDVLTLYFTLMHPLIQAGSYVSSALIQTRTMIGEGSCSLVDKEQRTLMQ